MRKRTHPSRRCFISEFDSEIPTENRLIEVTHDGIRTRYGYGADGSRFKRTEAPTAGGSGETTLTIGPIEVRDYGGPRQSLVVYPDPSVRIEGSETAYLHTDHLGSLRLVTSPTGATLERRAYLAYGEPIGLSTNTLPQEDHAWIGERYDAGAELMFLNARYHDPELAMFTQPDWWEPTEPGVGTNRYSYGGGDPVNGRDPGGNSWEKPTFGERAVNAIAGFFGRAVSSLASRARNGGSAPERLSASLQATAEFITPGLAATQASVAAFGDRRHLEGTIYALGATGEATLAIVTLGTGQRIANGLRAILVSPRPLARPGLVTSVEDSTSAIPNGVVYQRSDLRTGECYVGQCISAKRYAERQREHDRKLGTAHEYTILGRADPGSSLDVLEESMIRGFGGTQSYGGTLANMRHQMNDLRYRQAGGTVDLPYGPR